MNNFYTIVETLLFDKLFLVILVSSTFALEGCFEHIKHKEAIVSDTPLQFAC